MPLNAIIVAKVVRMKNEENIRAKGKLSSVLDAGPLGYTGLSGVFFAPRSVEPSLATGFI